MVLYSESESRDLIRLRYFHHLLNEMLKKKQFDIPIHLGFGHEAVAVGLQIISHEEDAVCLTHRNAAYNLAFSKSLSSVIPHYKLQNTPVGAGAMASMNLAMDGTSITYTSSILGNNLPVAAGIAMNRELSARQGVVFVATGDGAMEEGVFWETMIFARSHNLKLVIIVENNDYSMSSTIDQRRSPIDLSKICEGVGVEYRKLDGASLNSVKTGLIEGRAVSEVGKPVIVEIQLSTFCQHAGPTPGWPDDPLRIDLEDGLLLGDNPKDPLVHLAGSIGRIEFDRLARLIIEEHGQ